MSRKGPDTSEREDSVELAGHEPPLPDALSAAGIAFWEWRFAEESMAFSPGWLSMLGYDEGDIEHTPEARKSLVHPDDLPDADSVLERYLAGDAPSYDREIRLQTKSGDYGWTHERVVVVERDDRGAPVRAFGLACDISERVAAESALQDSRQALEALLENAAQGIVASRADGVIVSVNSMAEQILGYEREELVGMPIESLLPRDLASRHTHHRADYFEKPRNRPMGIGMDLTALRKDGTTVPVEISLSHVQRDDGALVVSFLTDITERKRSEEQRLSLQRQLEHATKMEAVGRLAGGIAHDFNNLLTALSGFSEIVLDQLDAEHPLREGAVEVKKLCERSTSLVRQLLTVSRKQIMEPIVLDLNDRVTEMEKLLRGLIGEDIELRTTLAADLGGIKADPGQLEQVILNLLVNARDAMPQGGVITIETENATVEAGRDDATPGEYVRLAVTDTGVGMTPETLSHIYEPFFTTKERGKGTGLGLATVYGIVDQSGGTIDATSRLNHGTTFTIRFPRVDEAARPTPPERSSRSESESRECVLLIEDENVVRMVAREALRKAGYDVLEARNGEDALEVVGHHDGTIDLVVTDVVMPKMGGLELVEELEKQHGPLDVLFMSGHVDDVRGHQRILRDRHAFIEKPFSRTALQRKVRERLDLAKRR